MRLIAIAKSIQPFLKNSKDINAVYKTIIDNPNLDFINKILNSSVDFIILVFLAHKISKGESVNQSTISNIKNNLFLFNKIEFENENSQIECSDCGGDGNISCDECNGDGYFRCDECYGNGEVECPDCDGQGSDEEDNTCENCGGSGKVDCSECYGEGTTDCSNCRNGQEDCNNCNGNGEVDTDEYIPYNITIYASYRTQLKDEVNYQILRNNPIKFDDSYSDECLMIYRRDYGAGEGQSEEINHKFQDESYFDEIIDDNLDSYLTYPKSNSVIQCQRLAIISDRFID